MWMFAYYVCSHEYLLLSILIFDQSQYAAADSLDDSYCAWLRGKPRPTSTSLSSSSPATAQTGGNNKLA